MRGRTTQAAAWRRQACVAARLKPRRCAGRHAWPHDPSRGVAHGRRGRARKARARLTSSKMPTSCTLSTSTYGHRSDERWALTLGWLDKRARMPSAHGSSLERISSSHALSAPSSSPARRERSGGRKQAVRRARELRISDPDARFEHAAHRARHCEAQMRRARARPLARGCATPFHVDRIWPSVRRTSRALRSTASCTPKSTRSGSAPGAGCPSASSTLAGVGVRPATFHVTAHTLTEKRSWIEPLRR